MHTRKTGHVHTVGTLDLSDDAVGGGMGSNGRNDGERVTHFD